MATFWNVSSWIFLIVGALAIFTGYNDSLSLTAVGVACWAMSEIEKLKK